VEIRHLRYFVAVAEELHFGRAAERLHMSQPPLSKRIAELERELGTTLLQRTSRHVELTAEGLRLLPLAREALRTFDAVRVEGRALAPSRALRIGFPTDTGRDVLAELEARLLEADLRLEWVEATTSEQRVLLDQGRIELGVLRLPLDPAGLWLSGPLRQELGVITAPDHPLAGETPVALSELDGQRLLMFSRSIAPGLYDDLLAQCMANGYRPGEITQGIRSSDSLVVQRELATGAAVMFGTREWASRSGAFRWRPVRDGVLHWDTAVACRRDTAEDEKIRLALRTLCQALVTHDGWRRLAADDITV
jgi:DNA-binding transcriptional LysR family regulator